MKFGVFAWRAAVLSTCLLTGGVQAQEALVAGQEAVFTFIPSGFFSNKPVPVYYYKAPQAGPDAKVLIAIHGAERDATIQRSNWQSWAQKNNAVVLAPQFDKGPYPDRLFQWGGMEDSDPQHWTFQIVEQLFQKVRRDEHLNAERYFLFGHSAGGQFVHRFTLMMNESHVSIAVAANAGSYTMPTYQDSFFSRGFPWFASEKRLPPARLAEAFSHKMVVMLGEEDTKSDALLPKEPEAMAQGEHRFARGQNFYKTALEQAQRLHVDLAWTLQTVPGVGHSPKGTTKQAEKIFTNFAN